MQVSGLQGFGLTRQKASYCHGLAERILSGSLDLTLVARGPMMWAGTFYWAFPGSGLGA